MSLGLLLSRFSEILVFDLSGHYRIKMVIFSHVVVIEFVCSIVLHSQFCHSSEKRYKVLWLCLCSSIVADLFQQIVFARMLTKKNYNVSRSDREERKSLGIITE